MSRDYFCLDCKHIAPLDKHGRYGICISDAAVSVEASNLISPSLDCQSRQLVIK